MYASRDPRPLKEIAIIDQETIEQISSQIPPPTVDLSNYVIKVTGKSLVFDIEISKIHAPRSDDQDLSGLQPKETGKGLSTNDLTDILKGYYDAGYFHSLVAHAPLDAQKNSDITKAEIEAKLTGEIFSHTHAGGGGGLSQQQIEGII